MSFNTTSSQFPPLPTPQVVVFSLQVLLGLVVVLMSAPITFVVLYYRKLRKRNELVLVANTAFFDTMYAVSYLSWAAMSLANQGGTKGISAWTCMTYFYNTGLVGLGNGCLTCLFAISVDRFICVVNVNKYLSLGKSYIVPMALAPFVAAIISSAVSWVGAATQPPVENIDPATCSPSNAVPGAYGVSGPTLNIPASAGSVLIYLTLLLVLWCRKDQTNNASLQKVKHKRQLAVTKLLSLLNIATIIGFLAPAVASVVVQVYFPPGTIPKVISYIIIVRYLHTLFFALLFWFKPSDIKDHLMIVLRKVIRAKQANVVGIKQPKNSVSTSSKRVTGM